MSFLSLVSLFPMPWASYQWSSASITVPSPRRTLATPSSYATWPDRIAERAADDLERHAQTRCARPIVSDRWSRTSPDARLPQVSPSQHIRTAAWQIRSMSRSRSGVMPSHRAQEFLVSSSLRSPRAPRSTVVSPALSSRSSHNFANRQSRFTVSGDTCRASAVSSRLSPAKNRSSTT
jgi:hypothetical protein